MKIGFRIEIQNDLNEQELEVAKKFADYFIEKSKDGKYPYKTDGGRSSKAFWRRGIVGFSINSKEIERIRFGSKENEINLIFRRHSRNKRIFAVVREECLEFESEQCPCALHKGGKKAKYKVRPKTFIYYEIGDIKG